MRSQRSKDLRIKHALVQRPLSRQETRRRLLEQAFESVTSENLRRIETAHGQGFAGMVRKERRRLARAYSAGARKKLHTQKEREQQ